MWLNETVLRGCVVSRAWDTSPGRSWLALVITRVAQGITPFLPLRGRSSTLGEGKALHVSYSDGVAVGEEARARRD